MICILIFFFFSSRRRHTRSTRDWSSDVCSAERTWQGKLLADNLPQTEAKRIPIPLTNKGGGNIAVKPATKTDPDGLVPQNQQYLVPIELLMPDHSITPGTLAYVKVSCQWRTCAWWAWRAFSSAFDLGMDPSDWI